MEHETAFPILCQESDVADNDQRLLKNQQAVDV